ncbi:MAG: hypothetical protein ACRDF7_02250 [Candidatus Limnocylindrales bacterium]
MDARTNSLLGEIASQAAVERTSFLLDASRQLHDFMHTHQGRIAEIGGLVLIDEEPDYLAVSTDGTFQSRTRYRDEKTGEWVSETEKIESVAELVELYNPAEVYAAFAEAAREEAGLPAEPTAEADLIESTGVAPVESSALYAGAADAWAAGRERVAAPATKEEAAHQLYDLALTFQERSQESEALLIDHFEEAASALAGMVGDMIVADDEDERLTLRGNGRFHAEVVPEDQPDTWRQLDDAEELVQFYDPTDIFGDLAEAIAEAFPQVAPELDDGGDKSA